MSVSIITSLYRAEKHLASYSQNILQFLYTLNAAALPIEIVIIANDATPTERALLAPLSDHPNVQILYVPRESLYASWNRGVRAAQGTVIGFWNVDDQRRADALIRGYEQIRQGCQLVYFAYEVIRPTETRRYPAIPFDPIAHRRQMKCGPFFLFDRALFEQIGPFDERFRIAGDFEWCARATDYISFCPIDQLGGAFYLHGENLSDSGNPLQIAEDNVIHLLRRDYHWLKPIDPVVMRQTWAKWESALPPEIEAQLWGEGADERWIVHQQTQQRLYQRQRIEAAIRWLPKQIIDRTGLRRILAKWGIVKARK